MITGKYIRGEATIHNFVAKSNVSNAWKGIISAAHIIQKGARIEIGNGKNTFFWRDRWLDKSLLLEVALKEISSPISYKMVYQYWDKNSGWKWLEH